MIIVKAGFSFFSKSDGEAGFTLVEMAIVLMIIGILIGGLLKGEELYRIVQVRRVMADINAISAATKGFQDRYGTAPGDFPLATTRVPNCTAANFCVNGDSNGFVGRTFGSSGWNIDQNEVLSLPAIETTMFWKHLALAGFLKNVLPNANPASAQWGRTHPSSSVVGGYVVFADTHRAGSAISLRMQIAPRYADRNAAVDLAGQRPFTIKQAIYMDEKYDDGIAGAGYMWGIPYGSYPVPCRLGSTYSTTDREGFNCQFHYVFH